MSRTKKVCYESKVIEEVPYKGEVQKVDNEFEVKKAKVASLIREINEVHCSGYYERKLLALIFDLDKLNDFGKIIVEKAKFVTDDNDWANWRYYFFSIDIPKESPSKRQEITSDWVRYCRQHRTQEAFYFILCALLVVTVDENDKEKNLSIICDFARMFMITDDEIRDMVELIKVIYGQDGWDIIKEKGFSTRSEEDKKLLSEKQEEFKNNVKSERTFKMFSQLIKLYMRVSGKQMLNDMQKGIIV